MSGRFIAIEGPGGVGKSTVTDAIARRLRGFGVPVHQTREPSDSAIGRLARHGTDTWRGMALACLIAADRYAHVDHEIRPAITQGLTVVCDRYIGSSLVLQNLDGVEREVIWELNRHTLMPDLVVILTAGTEVIEQRLAGRGAHSRYEREPGGTQRERVGYRDAARFLLIAGVRVLQLDTSTAEPDEIARAAVGAMSELTEGR